MDNNFYHQINSNTKNSKLLAEHTIRNKIRQLLSKYKHENNTNEHRRE